MLNQCVIVGRITTDLEEITNEDKKITIAVPRNYKNEAGIYEDDFIDCTLSDGIAQKAIQYYKKGDLVGIKGRLQKSEDKEMILIAEKLTFLSNTKE